MGRVVVVCVAVGTAAVILAGCGTGHRARMELVVRSDRDGDVALYALATSGAPRRIVGLPLGVGPVSVSADGRRLLVDGPRLEVLTSTGKSAVVLRRSEPIEGLDAAISPDGSRVVYPSGGGLAIRSVGGSARAALPGSNAGAPAWSPDGDRVAYTGPSQLFVADADGKKAAAIAPMFVPQSSPAWSPDGLRLAYAAGASASSEVSDLWVVRAHADAKPLRIARDVYGTPAWSPDGRMLAFMRFVGSRSVAVAIVGRDGRGDRSLATADELDPTPTWSPDGRDVLYSRVGRVESVWSVAVRGGRPRRLTPFHDGNNEVVGWVRASTAREPAPRPTVVRSRRATTLEVPWLVDELAAGPSGIVVAPASSGAGSDVRPPLLTWDRGGVLRRIFAADCSNTYAQMSPRISTAGVLFDCDRSGPDTLDQSLQLFTNAGARRRFFHSTVGAGENYTGTFFNRLEAAGRLAVFDTVTQTTKANRARVTAKRLWRLDGTTPRPLRASTGLGDPVSVDRDRVLLQGGAAGLELMNASGQTVLQLHVFRPHELRYDSPPRAMVTGDRIAVVLRRRLVVFDATSGRRRASWPLPGGRLRLGGAADGRVALVRGDDVIVLSLATGRVAHVHVPHRDLRPIRRLGYFPTVEAVLEPDDLVYTYDVAGPPYGRVVVVPLRVLRFR